MTTGALPQHYTIRVYARTQNSVTTHEGDGTGLPSPEKEALIVEKWARYN